MTYRVEVIEILSKFVYIEANSKEEAECKCKEMYHNSEIVLDSGDFDNVEFECVDL